MSADAREAAAVEAVALEAKAAGMTAEDAAETLVRAADIRFQVLSDQLEAARLLRKALSLSPTCKPAINRLTELTAMTQQWSELVDVLTLAARAARDDEEKARVLAQRGDVLGRRLGRLAEARSMYREVARLSSSGRLRQAALTAVEQLDALLEAKDGSARRTGGAGGNMRERTFVANMQLPRRPAADDDRAAELFREADEALAAGKVDRAEALAEKGRRIDPQSAAGRKLIHRVLEAQGRIAELHARLLDEVDTAEGELEKLGLLELARLSDKHRGDAAEALDYYRQVLDIDPNDELAFAEAIAAGVRHRAFDVARKVLPQLTPRARAEKLHELAQSAAAIGDQQAAERYRAVAFEDDPRDVVFFNSRVQALQGADDRAVLGRSLSRRLEVVTDSSERRALLWELASLHETRGEPRLAAETLLETIALAPEEGDVDDAIQLVDRLSRRARDRSIAARAFEVALAREAVPDEVRSKRLVALARLRREDHGSDLLDTVKPDEDEDALPPVEPGAFGEFKSDADTEDTPVSQAAPAQADRASEVARMLVESVVGEAQKISRATSEVAAVPASESAPPAPAQRTDEITLDELVKGVAERVANEADRLGLDAVKAAVPAALEALALKDAQAGLASVEAAKLEDTLDPGTAEIARLIAERVVDEAADRMRTGVSDDTLDGEDGPAGIPEISDSFSWASAVPASADDDDGAPGVLPPFPRLVDEAAPAPASVPVVAPVAPPVPVPAAVAEPVADVEPPPPPLPERAAILAWLDAADLDTALEAIAAYVARGEEPGGEVWATAARRLHRLDRDEEAWVCLGRTLEGEADPVLVQVALRSTAEAALAAEDDYGAACALAALIEDHAPEAAKAERSAQVGRLFARAGASWVAERWFEQALHMRPNDLRTAHDLLHLHTSRGDAEAVARLATEWVLSPSSGRDGAEWLTSIALARISFGDLEGAAADLQAALRVDPIGDRAAAALLELGISADRWDWIDDALRQIRNRAAEAGDGRRAFEAAACLVAVGEPTDADRIAFDLVRREGCEPRPDQIEAWMHDLAGRPEAARPRVSGTPRERSQTLVEFALSRR